MAPMSRSHCCPSRSDVPCTRAAPAPNPGGRSAQIRELRPNPSPINHEARWQQVPNFYGLWDSLKFIGNRPGARQCSKPKASSEGCFPASPGSRPCQGAYTPPEHRRAVSLSWGGPPSLSPKTLAQSTALSCGEKKYPQPSWGMAFPLLVTFPSWLFSLLTVFFSSMYFPLKFPQRGIIFLISIWEKSVWKVRINQSPSLHPGERRAGSVARRKER